MSDPKLNTPSSSEMQIEICNQMIFHFRTFFQSRCSGYASNVIFNFLSIWCWAIIFNKYFKFKNEIKQEIILSNIFQHLRLIILLLKNS